MTEVERERIKYLFLQWGVDVDAIVDKHMREYDARVAYA